MTINRINLENQSNSKNLNSLPRVKDFESVSIFENDNKYEKILEAIEELNNKEVQEPEETKEPEEIKEPEKTEETKEPEAADDVKHFGKNSEVVKTPPVTEEQQKEIDTIVSSIVNGIENIGDYTETSSKVYVDENNKPMQEVITMTSETGELITITINYDAQGRIEQLRTQEGLFKDNSGKIIDFEYHSNGDITIKQRSGVMDEESGKTSDNMISYPQYTIKPDGKIYDKDGNELSEAMTKFLLTTGLLDKHALGKFIK